MSNTFNDLLLRKKIIQSESTRSGLTRAQRYSQISRNNFRRLPPAIENAPKPFLNTTVLLNGQDIQTIGTRNVTIDVDDNRIIKGTSQFDEDVTFNKDVTFTSNITVTFNSDIIMGGGILKVNEIVPNNQSNSIDINGSLDVTNFFRASKDAEVRGDFDVIGTATLPNLVSSEVMIEDLSVNDGSFNNLFSNKSDIDTLNVGVLFVGDNQHKTDGQRGHLFEEPINCGAFNPDAPGSIVDLYVNETFQIREKFTDAGYIFNTYDGFGDPYGELLVIGDKDDATGIAFFQYDLNKTTTIESKDGNFSITVGNVNKQNNTGETYDTKVYVDNTGNLLVGDHANSIGKDAKLVVQDDEYVKAVFKDSGGSGGGSAIRVKNEDENSWDMAIGQNNKFAINYNKDSFGELFSLDPSGILEFGDTNDDKFKIIPRPDHIEYSSTNQKHYFDNKVIIGDIPDPNQRPDLFEEYALNVEGIINASEIYLGNQPLSTQFKPNLDGTEDDPPIATDVVIKNTLNIFTTEFQDFALIRGNDPSGGENDIALYDKNTENMILKIDPSGSGNIIFNTGDVDRMEVTNDGRINIKNSTFINHSDERIKHNIQPLNSLGSLESIRKIKPKKYNYKTHDTGKKYGFIAQEIKNIIPEAVSIHDEVIALPKLKIQYTYTVINDLIHLSIDDVIEIKEDDKITIQVERMREQTLHYKPSVSPTYPYIWLNSENIDIKDYPIINLKARIIPDFHSLDYQPLWTVLTSGVQELDKQNITAREEINELKKENKTLRTELEELKKYVYSL